MGVCESAFHPVRFGGSQDNKSAVEMRDKAYNICREFLSGSWKKISSSDMVFKSVSGGLSNILYYCSLPSTHTPLNGEPSQVLLRMYGQLHSDHRPGGQTASGDSGESTTITDSVIFMLLSERKLGPKLYGIFPGGRLEEYIPARAMTCRELRDPSLSGIIARKLANVHCLDVPINKEPTWLFTTMRTWLSTIESRSSLEESSSSSSSNSSRCDSNPNVMRELLAFDFDGEIDWLEQFLKKVNSPTVFCHNDLQEGNILLPELAVKNKKHGLNKNASLGQNLSDDSVVLIDFEYCSYNYRASDIANHFCEWAFDYSNPEWPHFYADMNRFPNEDQRRHFIREYLKQYRKQRQEPGPVTAEEVERLMYETNHFTLASHLLWTLWSINNAQSSTIKFGYWDYGLARLKAYLKLKTCLMDNNKASFQRLP